LEKYIVLKLKVSKSVPCTVEENMRITYGKNAELKANAHYVRKNMCLEEHAVQHGSCGKTNDQVMYLFLDIYHSGNKNLHIQMHFSFLSCTVNQLRTWAKVVVFICAR